MKINLLEVYSRKSQYINKDVMGGYGMIAEIGDSFFAKLIEKQKKKSVNFPVLALAYLSAILKRNGHQVDYQQNVLPKDSDLVIIPSSIVDYKSEIDFAKKIKKETKAKVGFFGPFASVKPDIFLEVGDFVISGEPERWAQGLSGDSIPKGVVKVSPINNLDSLPFPDWSLFSFDKFSYRPNLKKKPFFPVLSSRGCAFRCLYCPYRSYYGGLRVRSPESVLEELKYLKKNFDVRSIQFRDPLFTAQKQRTVDISEGILKNNLGIEWGCETHADSLDYKLIDLMHRAGLRSVNLGIESVDAEMLRKNSRFSAKKQKEIEIINYCHKKGINVSAFYIFGMPEDNKRSILETIKYAKKLNTLVAQFFIFTPFPGTDFYEKLENKIFEKDWQRFTSFNPVFQHNVLSAAELLKLKEKAFVSYYFRPAYFFKHSRRIL